MRFRLLAFVLGWGWVSAVVAQVNPRLTTVAIDLTPLDPASFERLDGLALEKRILLRLVQDGFAVVRPEQGPDVLVSVRVAGQSLVLEALARPSVKSAIVLIDDRPRAELHLEVTQKLVALLRTALPSQISLSAPAPAARGPTASTNRTWLAAGQWEASSSVQVLARSGGADLLLAIGASHAIADLIWIDLDGGWSPSSAPRLHVNEWQLSTGASYRWILGTRWCGSAGLQLGTLAHQYAYSESGAKLPGGTRVDALLLLPLRITYGLSSTWQVGLHVTPGAANRSRGHETDAGFIWHRGALRVQSGVSVGATW